MATHEDPRYKYEAKKLRLLTSPVDGARVHKLVEKLSKMPRELYARYTKILSDPKSPMRVVKWQIVTGTITKVKKKGKLEFKIAGKDKTYKTRTRGRYTKFKLNGKKASRKKVKAGMVCKIWYEGNKSYAGRMECTN